MTYTSIVMLDTYQNMFFVFSAICRVSVFLDELQERGGEGRYLTYDYRLSTSNYRRACKAAL